MKPIRKAYRIDLGIDNSNDWNGQDGITIEEVKHVADFGTSWTIDELHSGVWHSKPSLVAWLRAAADAIEKSILE
jgi:hypothetical protein